MIPSALALLALCAVPLLPQNAVGINGIAIGGGGTSTIEAHFPVTTTGIKACGERIAAGTITSAKLSVDDGIPTGANLVVDVLTVAAATYATGGSAGASSIAASAKPTITTGGGVYAVTDSTLTGWTTAVSANTVFCIEVETAPTGGATSAHLILTLE